jgi:hypothetical protein
MFCQTFDGFRQTCFKAIFIFIFILGNIMQKSNDCSESIFFFPVIDFKMFLGFEFKTLLAAFTPISLHNTN